MAFTTRKSTMAIVEEVTENTPVYPTSGTQYIALQEGYDLTPNIETIETTELKSSIGESAPISGGKESPELSLSHYMRHSGVEGSKPNFAPLIKAAFGAEVVNATQYDTVGGSTAGNSTTPAVIKVDTGEGAQFQRGQLLLGKDGTNGYWMRPVQSISGDDLQLGFNLPSAPSAGVNLGKAIQYKPSDAPGTLTAWDFRGNEAALQVAGGMRITEMSIEANVGELLNASFTATGSSYYFDPINITATDTKLDFLDNVTTRVATVEAKLYKDPHDLADAIAASMNGLGSANTFTVTYSNTTGKFTITSNGTTLSLLWNTGGNAANTIGDKIGFNTASDSTAALTYTSANEQSWAAPQTPSLDNGQPLIVKNMEVMIGDFDDYGCSSTQSFTFTLSNESQDVNDICEESGKSGTIATKRSATIDCVLTLNKHDADKFHRFHSNSDVRFLFNFGSKSGGNWEAGKSGCVYVPAARITEYKVSDSDGLVVIEMTMKAYVGSQGLGEVYLNFV